MLSSHIHLHLDDPIQYTFSHISGNDKVIYTLHFVPLWVKMSVSNLIPCFGASFTIKVVVSKDMI